MYLSKLVLNPRSRRARSEAADPYQLHRTVMRAFPEPLPAGERVLFRMETDPRSGVMTVLVQSQSEPDWRWLDAEGRDYLLQIGSDPNPWVKPYNPEFHAGQPLIFRLRANPTQRRNSDKKRLGLYREDEQLAWLGRKAESGGFRVREVRVRDDGVAQGMTKERQRLNLLAVIYEGVLEVTHPELFLQTLAQGIGSGKGMGFGLLSVARPH